MKGFESKNDWTTGRLDDTRPSLRPCKFQVMKCHSFARCLVDECHSWWFISIFKAYSAVEIVFILLANKPQTYILQPGTGKTNCSKKTTSCLFFSRFETHHRFALARPLTDRSEIGDSFLLCVVSMVCPAVHRSWRIPTRHERFLRFFGGSRGKMA